MKVDTVFQTELGFYTLRQFEFLLKYILQIDAIDDPSIPRDLWWKAAVADHKKRFGDVDPLPM
jgi:hypothetical protein